MVWSLTLLHLVVTFSVWTSGPPVFIRAATDVTSDTWMEYAQSFWKTCCRFLSQASRGWAEAVLHRRLSALGGNQLFPPAPLIPPPRVSYQQLGTLSLTRPAKPGSQTSLHLELGVRWPGISGDLANRTHPASSIVPHKELWFAVNVRSLLPSETASELGMVFSLTSSTPFLSYTVARGVSVSWPGIEPRYPAL